MSSVTVPDCLDETWPEFWAQHEKNINKILAPDSPIMPGPDVQIMPWPEFWAWNDNNRKINLANIKKKKIPADYQSMSWPEFWAWLEVPAKPLTEPLAEALADSKLAQMSHEKAMIADSKLTKMSQSEEKVKKRFEPFINKRREMHKHSKNKNPKRAFLRFSR